MHYPASASPGAAPKCSHQLTVAGALAGSGWVLCMLYQCAVHTSRKLGCTVHLNSSSQMLPGQYTPPGPPAPVLTTPLWRPEGLALALSALCSPGPRIANLEVHTGRMAKNMGRMGGTTLLGSRGQGHSPEASLPGFPAR